MTTYACPKGHASEESDFCDTCGAKIDGAAAAPSPPPPVSAPAAVVATEPCPNCGTPRAGSSRFCEDCGYDHSTGRIPTLVPAAPAAAPAAGWTVTIAPDRSYFEDNAIDGIEFPENGPSRTVPLPPPQVRIGRRSTSKGTHPEIDLSDDDPGVSHSHALLTLSVDGVWLVSDVGSTNGTYINDDQQPLTAGQSRALADGDRVHVGAWTTLTLKAPTA
ncbi:FHA domain-containing protein [Actinoplanes sp. LDG1-06]|uniref:FHA domain-containing protein n=1 Tax=Paractinoplanes ovalisporus TaxID=2810368 RepID=A0ABS2AJ65_9ACTN|nr:FHA domain-containing protein [Actinoplanes ovalisporus]MBM2619855.1 FHA domain-containing protein [Actinoplanes ovalisporus]